MGVNLRWSWTYQAGDWDEEGIEERPGDAVEGKGGLEDGMDSDASVRLWPVGDDAHDGGKGEHGEHGDQSEQRGTVGEPRRRVDGYLDARLWTQSATSPGPLLKCIT